MAEHLTAVRDHCLAPSRSVDSPAVYGGRYARLFADLPVLVADEDRLLALGDVCVDSGGEDGAIAAGWPLFGQFVAHDITADRSPLSLQTEPGNIRNFRTPRVNLESVYGAGPVGAPYLFDVEDPAKLLLSGHDVPRNQQGIALIGDPRNDVHVFMNQLQVAFLRAHNRFVDRLRQDGEPEAELFEAARRATTWHYQWIVVHELLPGLAGEDVMGRLLSEGPRFYRPAHETDPYIPFEFADAAYRYGHGQVRQRYRLQPGGPELSLFPDLVGFAPVPPEHEVQWPLLFDFPGRPAAQRAKRIDGTLASALIHLPHAITGDVDVDAYRSLAVRDLQRGQAIGLPSGETVARAMGVEPLSEDDLDLRRRGWEDETPLWYYVLREAAVRGGGDRLGPVGGTIVAEVLVGIVDADPGSQRAVEPDWRPTVSDPFGIADLLAFGS
jgi:Animal haem peroxidase